MIRYRKGNRADAAAYIAHMNRMGGESDFLSFSRNAFFLTEEQVGEFLDDLDSAENQAVFFAETPKGVVGQVTLESSPRPRLMHTAELRIGVAKSHWGTGVAKQLMSLAIEYFEENEHLKRLSLEVSMRNERGIALYRKFGFTDEGIKKMAFKFGDDYDDLLIMALLK